jgi:hypothetical protein
VRVVFAVHHCGAIQAVARCAVRVTGHLPADAQTEIFNLDIKNLTCTLKNNKKLTSILTFQVLGFFEGAKVRQKHKNRPFLGH